MNPRRRQSLLHSLARMLVTAARVRQLIAPTGARYVIRASRSPNGGVSAGTFKACTSRRLADGWFPCDGRVLDGEMFPELFVAIGTSCGAAESLWWHRILGLYRPFRLPRLVLARRTLAHSTG
jgi:hypothetical protein